MVKKCLDCKIEINNYRKRCVECKSMFDKTLKKKYIEDNRKKHNAAMLVYKKKHKDKVNSYMITYNNKNKNKIHARTISRRIPLHLDCDICHDTKNLTKHHWRYDKPKLFNTLCKFCHNVQHGRSFYE